MDGERTHHLLRRCGHRGQPPAARCWRGSRVWMSTWTACRRAGTGCGRRCVVPRLSGSCTVCPQRRPQRRPRECGWAVGARSSGCGRRPDSGRRWCVLWVVQGASVDGAGRVARYAGGEHYPQDCPQPVDLWTNGAGTSYLTVGHGRVAERHTGGEKPVDNAGLPDIEGYRMIRRHPDTTGSGEGGVSRPAA